MPSAAVSFGNFQGEGDRVVWTNAQTTLRRLRIALERLMIHFLL